MRSNEIIEMIREMYKPGIRVRLIKMNDSQSPSVGTEGTVLGVDDIGSVIMKWDTGSNLSVVIEIIK